MSNLPFAKKTLGQHWLEDKASLEAMVTAAQVSSQDTVLEIGPGTGTLTDELLTTGARIVALEFDQQRLKDLQKKYDHSNKITVVQGDIRKYDLSPLPAGYKIVANIPYYLTANLLRKLVDDTNKPSIAVLLVQKEVAQRVVAGQGDLSQIAIFVQAYYQPTLSQLVPAHLFVPPPKVDSQILVLKKRDQPLFDADDQFMQVVKAGFSEKRKKLRSSLAHGLGVKKGVVEQYLADAQIGPNARAQELTLEQWFSLRQVIYK